MLDWSNFLSSEFGCSFRIGLKLLVFRMRSLVSNLRNAFTQEFRRRGSFCYYPALWVFALLVFKKWGLKRLSDDKGKKVTGDEHPLEAILFRELCSWGGWWLSTRFFMVMRGLLLALIWFVVGCDGGPKLALSCGCRYYEGSWSWKVYEFLGKCCGLVLGCIYY